MKTQEKRAVASQPLQRKSNPEAAFDAVSFGDIPRELAHQGGNITAPGDVMDVAPVQMKKETTLQSGGLNMVGETHTDYPNKSARQYEAKKVKQVLGPSYQYFTEGNLTIDDRNIDFADPVDLRLEQAISFVQSIVGKLVPELLSLDPQKFDASLKADQSVQGSVAEIAKKLAPRVVAVDYDQSAIVEEIRLRGYDLSILDALADPQTWEKVAPPLFDQNSHLEDRFYALYEEIAKLRDQLEDELDLEDQKSSAPPAQDKTANTGAEVVASAREVDHLVKAKILAFQIKDFFTEYKGRLPIAAKLYAHHKMKGYGERFQFEFDLGAIPKLLEEWGKLEQLNDIIEMVLMKGHDEFLKSVVEAAQKRLPALIACITAGLPPKGAASVREVVEQRSRAMHAAAEKLQSLEIVWKVGNRHIEDIEKLSEKGEIKVPTYSYLEKDAFKSAYIKDSEMVAHQEDEKDADLRTGKDALDKMVLRGEEMLKNDLFFYQSYATVREIELRQASSAELLQMAEKIESGALPKLEKLTIHGLTADAELRNRLSDLKLTVVFRT